MMMNYWKKISKDYNSIRWVNNNQYLEKLIDCSDLKSNHIVLDVGTGTGIIAKTVCPLVKEIHAIDNSVDMLNQAKLDNEQKIKYKLCDILSMDYENNTFNRIIARMVFHHILTNSERCWAIKQISRVLKPNGIFIFSEGVPPSIELLTEYNNIFELKEERVSFLPNDIEKLLKISFKNIEMIPYYMHNISTRQWLESNNINREIIEKIIDLHLNSSDLFKREYNLIEKENPKDAIVTWKYIIAIAKEPIK